MALEQIPPAVANVACSGATHRLEWRDGKLNAPDHADPEGERALAVLGGAPCRCVELLDAWHRHSADPRALALGPRRSGFTPPPSRNRGGVYVGAGPGANDDPPEDPLLQLLSLTGSIPQRLVVTVAAAIARSADADPARDPLLHAALYGRVITALADWLGGVPEFTLDVIDQTSAPALICEGTGWRASLPFTWLTNVWGAGLETVAGRFVLSAEFDPAAGWKLVTIDQTMTVNTCTLAAQ